MILSSRNTGAVFLSLMAASVLTSGPLASQEPSEGKTPESREWYTAPFTDFWGAAKDFGTATWLVASSPARMDRRSALEFGGVLLVGGALFALDEEIRDGLDAKVNPEGNGGFLREVGDFVEPLGLQGDTNVYFAGAAVLGYLTHQDWIKIPARQILYSQWIGGMGRQLAGHIVGRHRPSEELGPYAFETGEGTSFPSGHSAVAFELAYVLSHHIHRWPASVVLFGLAGTIAFQRADSNSHWASDAWIGSAWGLLVAKTVVAAEESDRLQIEPMVDVGSGRAGMGLRIRF